MNKLKFLSLFEFIDLEKDKQNYFLLDLNSFNGQSLSIKLKNFYKLLTSLYNQYNKSNIRLFRNDYHKAFIVKNNYIYIDKNYSQNFIDEIKGII